METFTNLQVLELRSNQFSSLKVNFIHLYLESLQSALGSGPVEIAQKTLPRPKPHQRFDAPGQTAGARGLTLTRE